MFIQNVYVGVELPVFEGGDYAEGGGMLFSSESRHLCISPQEDRVVYSVDPGVTELKRMLIMIL